jgi:DNA repair protein RadA/Sms
MVDTVLYFEGERGHHFRILRTVKNRFGPTDEIGVFEMSDRGLSDVANPSALFLGERRGHVSGTCVFAGIEGTRPVLTEIQALVAPSSFATPRHAVVGWDSNRLAMVLAVLEGALRRRRSAPTTSISTSRGGCASASPAADLAVAAAVVSSLADEAVPSDMVVFGEIGLGGEVRPVSQREARLREAAKLGFRRPWCREGAPGTGPAPRTEGIAIDEIEHLSDLVARFQPADRPMKRSRRDSPSDRGRA